MEGHLARLSGQHPAFRSSAFKIWITPKLFNYCRHNVEEKYHVEPGDLLFAWSGTIGTSFGARIWRGPSGFLNQHIFRVIPDPHKLTSDFALIVFRAVQDSISRQAHGFKTSFVHVRKSDLAKIALPLPSRAEQRAIAQAVSDADALIGSLEQLLAKKRHIKEGAMEELLTGKRRLPGLASPPWQIFALGELFTFGGGVAASREQLSEQGQCYLHYGDIHMSGKTFVEVADEYSRIPKLDVQLAKVPRGALLEDGDVVFVDASEDHEGSSKHVVVVNPTGIPFISGLHTIVAKPMNEAVANSFRRYCFQSTDVKTQFRFYAVGTKVLGVSKSNIKKIAIAVPPRREQEAIAEILIDMDREIAALEQKVEKTRLVKQGMMQELLTGRIRLVDIEAAEKPELVAVT